MQPSPYTPGSIASRVPGRAQQLHEFDERLSYLVDLRRLIPRIRVEHAPRGVGKTSLLREYQRRAEARGVLTVWVTAGEPAGLVAQIGEGLRTATTTWRGEAREALHALLESSILSVGVPGVVKLDASAKGMSGGRMTSAVREFEAAVRKAADSPEAFGLIVFIDEIQAADEAGLRTLVYAWQHLQAEGADVPAAVLAAGLPDAPDKIASVVTFAERLAFRSLGLLSVEAQEIAISGPARGLGVLWDQEALGAAIDVARGYPYSVQLIADATWSAAGHPDAGSVLTREHVNLGREAMRADLDALFRARWANASPQEQDILKTMAALGDGAVRRSDIARLMNVTPGSLSVPRARLIDKGFVVATERGMLEFSVPGFAEFVRGYDGL